MRRTAVLLTAKERRRAAWVAMISLFGVVIDVVGLSLVLPLMMIATNPKSITTIPSIQRVKVWSGIETAQSFILVFAAVVVVVFLLKNAFTLFTNYLQSRFSYDVATNLARRQFMKYYNRGYVYLKDTNSADIANNILNVPVFFVSGVLVSIINFLVEASVLALIVVGIAVADIQLFLFLVAVLTPSGFLIYGVSKNRLYAIGQKQIKLGILTLQLVNQAIFGYVDVRLTNKENFFMDTYLREQIKQNDLYKTKHLLNMVPTKALEVIGVLGIFVILTYAYLKGRGEDEVFAFVAIFAAAASRVLPALNRILTAVMSIKGQLYTLELLEEGSLPTEMQRLDVYPLAFERDIEFRDLTFQFESADRPALQSLNLTVRKGERIGIIGESGSGKTTLMNLLLRFLRENAGGIYVDGRKLEDKDIASWRAKVGYVQQSVFLIDATLRQNVAFGQHPEEVNDEQLEAALAQASLTDFVKGLPNGVETPVGEMGARLSGGQRQRIGIARALYYQSSVLVFDEATSALDSDTENAITESIQSLHEDLTVFVVAHRITTLRHCDRILELKDGRLVNIWSYPDLVHEKMLK